MYELLQQLCKEKGTNITNLCIVITGSSGNLPTWKKGNINPESLRKIADYFDVSADYLLGRTDNPHETSISVTDNKQTSLTGNNSISVNSAAPSKDTLTQQFIQKFEQLDFDDKVDVMQYVKNKK